MAAKKSGFDPEAMAKLFGMDISKFQSPEIAEAQAATAEFEAAEDAIELEAESVLFYMDNRKAFIKKKCIRCERKFLSTYTAVAYCTRECRKEALAEKGMSWNPLGRTELDRWGGTIPRIIGPTATETLEGMTFPDPEPTPEKETPSPADDTDYDELDALMEDMGIDAD